MLIDVPYYTMQSLEAAEKAKLASQQHSDNEAAAKKETENTLKGQLDQLRKEIEAKVHCAHAHTHTHTSFHFFLS